MSTPATDDLARIDAVLGELRRVWKRNPRKSLVQVVHKAASFTATFIPDEVTDEQILSGLTQIGPGQPAPDGTVSD